MSTGTKIFIAVLVIGAAIGAYFWYKKRNRKVEPTATFAGTPGSALGIKF